MDSYDKNEVTKLIKEKAKKILTKKIQVGDSSVGHNPNDGHAVGDKWTDSEGYEWEQKEGFRVKSTSMPAVGMFDKVCKDCEKPCTKSYDKETHIRMNRCYHCQINFEVDLKQMKIGNNGNKWQFWVKLQKLRAWDSIDTEIEQYVEERHKLNQKNPYDKTVANALANHETDISMGKQ